MFGDCVFPYLFIDASTEEYEEEEGDYEEEEEENFDHCTNQGKLIPMQALLVQDDLISSQGFNTMVGFIFLVGKVISTH